jgi:hypothetical protein
MKVTFKDLMVGSCFVDPKGDTKKKVSDSKASSVDDVGKVKTRKVKSAVEVEPTACELKYLGVGLRRHPELVVEIGDGNPYKRSRRKS